MLLTVVFLKKISPQYKLFLKKDQNYFFHRFWNCFIIFRLFYFFQLRFVFVFYPQHSYFSELWILCVLCVSLNHGTKCVVNQTRKAKQRKRIWLKRKQSDWAISWFPSCECRCTPVCKDGVLVLSLLWHRPVSPFASFCESFSDFQFNLIVKFDLKQNKTNRLNQHYAFEKEKQSKVRSVWWWCLQRQKYSHLIRQTSSQLISTNKE